MKKKLAGIILMCTILTTGCNINQTATPPTKSGANNRTTVEAVEDVSSVDAIQYYSADINVKLAVSGELEQTTADIEMLYNSHMDADLQQQLIHVTEDASMNMTGTEVSIESDSYSIDAYIESDGANCCYFYKKSTAESEGTWTMENLLQDGVNAPKLRAFATYSVLDTLNTEDNTTYSGSVSYADIGTLIDYLHLYRVDGGLLSNEISSQFENIQICYVVNENKMPESIILDLTDSYNKATLASDTNKVAEYSITITFSYPEEIKIEKPDMGDISKVYNPEEDNFVTIDNEITSENRKTEVVSK